MSRRRSALPLLTFVAAAALLLGTGDRVADAPSVAITPVADAGADHRPVRIVIPALHVDARLDPLGLDAKGRLAVPPRASRPGWWTGGVAPGEPGTAVVAGHVDSRSGPAVFAELGSLRRGDHVEVTARDGSVARFVVVRRAVVPRDAFPTEAVYGASPSPVLRLVTCTGRYDAAGYRDRVVVWTEPA